MHVCHMRRRIHTYRVTTLWRWARPTCPDRNPCTLLLRSALGEKVCHMDVIWGGGYIWGGAYKCIQIESPVRSFSAAHWRKKKQIETNKKEQHVYLHRNAWHVSNFEFHRILGTIFPRCFSKSSSPAFYPPPPPLFSPVHVVPSFPVVVHYVVRKNKKKQKKEKKKKNRPRTMPAIPGLTHSIPCPGAICPCCAAAIAAMRPRKYKTPVTV